jgi:hypothetical protein
MFVTLHSTSLSGLTPMVPTNSYYKIKFISINYFSHILVVVFLQNKYFEKQVKKS